ncbi:hypothetical protein [uncultured Nostoc sp.]|nr:hypothetical protein [uncultured Nostoc sp.]
MNQIGEMETSLWHSFNGGNLPNGVVSHERLAWVGKIFQGQISLTPRILN